LADQEFFSSQSAGEDESAVEDWSAVEDESAWEDWEEKNSCSPQSAVVEREVFSAQSTSVD